MKFTWHYRCRHCATWAITARDSGSWVRCNGCGGAKTFQFRSNALKPDELEAWNYANEHGVAHLPLPGSMPMALTALVTLSIMASDQLKRQVHVSVTRRTKLSMRRLQR